MIRPFTCICLVLAAGSGLYLYQVKQRAFALDADLRSTFHDIDMARERTRMLRADWALMNDPERLQSLADQYLTLKPMAPSQLMTLDQLAAALPPPLPPGKAPASTPDGATPDGPPALPATDPTHGMPMAQATPMVLPHTHPTVPQVALLQPAPTEPAATISVTPSPATVSAPAPVLAPSLIAAEPAPTAPVPVMTPASPKRLASANPKPVHHWTRHTVPAQPAQPWLADATPTGFGVTPETQKPRHPHHHAAPPAPAQAPAQIYAANEPVRQPYTPPRITPPAATVMYSPGPVSGSSLGMAASASLAPPRPLYSTSQ